MKRLTAFLVMIMASAAYGQADTSRAAMVLAARLDTATGDKVFLIVEQLPEYPGGEEALKEFIRSNIVYPVAEKAQKIDGKVYLEFIVEKDGSLSGIHPKIPKSPGLDAEAVRIAHLLRFRPGMQSGHLCRVTYILPVRFELP